MGILGKSVGLFSREKYVTVVDLFPDSCAVNFFRYVDFTLGLEAILQWQLQVVSRVLAGFLWDRLIEKKTGNGAMFSRWKFGGSVS